MEYFIMACLFRGTKLNKWIKLQNFMAFPFITINKFSNYYRKFWKRNGINTFMVLLKDKFR